MTDYKPKHFDRENPCTKVDLHNCFFKGGEYVSRKLIEAKTVIGENAPKYLLSKGYAVLQTQKGVDYYALTKDGELWLISGLLKHLKLHPECALDCRELPLGYGLKPVKKRLK